MMECCKGGIGEFLPPGQDAKFGLKIVKLKSNDKFEPDKFWGEARSIRTYGSSIRFLAGSSKVPFSERYYINKEDPLLNKFPYPVFEEHFTGWLWFFGLKENVKKRFQDYILVPEIFLQEIHDRKLEADLLLAYPMAKGGEQTLEDFYGKTFTCEDVKGLIIQLLAVILEFYRCGCAHGDIKPANIMVSQISDRKIFRLVDYGSIHSASAPSNSGTRAFYDADLYRTIKRKTGDTLLARVFTDCYALSMTVLAMALGKTPDAGGLFNPRTVTSKWKDIADLWEVINPGNIENLSIEQLEKIVAANTPIQLPVNWTPFEVPLKENVFTELSRGYPVYGKLYKQLRLFSDEAFDPMMRISDIEYNKYIYRQVPEFYHLPLIKDYGKNTMIFHAPDDLQSRKRPTTFSCYTPRNLSNSRPTNAEVKKLMQYGKILDRYFSENCFAEPLLPGKEDIFWCDGALKMLWKKEKEYVLNTRISYEAYFYFLATGEAEFCDQDWQTLLPYFPELEKYGTPERWAAVLNNAKKSPSLHSWAFKLTAFREYVICEARTLSPEEFSKILEYMPELESFGTPEVWNTLLNEIRKNKPYTNYNWIFQLAAFRKYVAGEAKNLSPEDWKMLLKKIPDLEKKFTVPICRKLLKAFAEDMKYACFFANEIFRKKIAKEKLDFSMEQWLCIRKYTCEYEFQIADIIMASSDAVKTFFNFSLSEPAVFLRCFPEDIRAGFNGRSWGKFICINPELLKYMPERIFPFLNRKTWVRILGRYPELIEKCSCLNRFSAREWCSIILQKPELQSFIPENIDFSDQKKRLEKLQNFS